MFDSIRLESLEIPRSVTTIGPCAFQENQLSIVTIPSNVTSLGTNAFNQNPITQVSIPDSIVLITNINEYGYVYSLIENPTLDEIRTYCFGDSLAPPLPVENLQATAFANEITVTWDASLQAEGYIIHRQPGQSEMVQHATVTEVQFVETVEADGRYSYRVYPYRIINGEH